MDNQNTAPLNPNENTRFNPPANSVDGFARPTPQSAAPIGYSSPSSEPANNVPTHPDTNKGMDDKAPGISKPVVSGGGQKKSMIWTAILVLLIIVVFVGGLYGVYKYEQKKITSLNAQITSLNSQITSLNSKLSSSKSSTTVNGQFPTTASANTTLIKQYPTYYIAYVKPAAACSTVSQVNTLITSLETSLKSSFSTIQQTTT
jgi:hypothetical protein